jgi:outer membrane protein TolC
VRLRYRAATIGCLITLLALELQGLARAEGWKAAPPLPMDTRDILSTINKDSNLYLLYQQYRDNRDGLQKGARRINLEEAISLGITGNPTLISSVAEIQTSQWSRLAIIREWVPSLTIKTSDPGVLGYASSTTRFETKTDGNDPIETQRFKRGYQSNPYANLSWAFLDPSRGSRLAALAAQDNALRNRFTFTSRELILAVQTAYTTLQEALGREKDYIELFNQAVHVYIAASQSRRPAGELSRLEAQAVSLLIARVKAHKSSLQAADALASLINLEPGNLALPSEQPAVVPAWSLSRADSIQRALRQREELQTNAWDVDALLSNARAIRLRALPAVALSSQVKRVVGNQAEGSLTGAVSGKLSRTSGFDTFFGLTFDWKVFDGGIRSAEANAVQARAQQTTAQGNLTRLSITRQVTDAYATYVASRILVDAARSDVNASRLSLQSALTDYEAGRHTDAGTSVVQALSKMQNALDTYRNLVAEQNISIYQLYRYTASWPQRTETLVNSQYGRWLPPTAPGKQAALTTPREPPVQPLPDAPGPEGPAKP